MSRTAAEIIKEFREIAAHPEKAIANHKRETGKGAVGIMPVYCPEEIVHASGYLPIGMWGHRKRQSQKHVLICRHLPVPSCSLLWNCRWKVSMMN